MHRIRIRTSLLLKTARATTAIVTRMQEDLRRSNEEIAKWNELIGDNSELGQYAFGSNFTEDYTGADLSQQYASAFTDAPTLNSQMEPIQATLQKFEPGDSTKPVLDPVDTDR